MYPAAFNSSADIFDILSVILCTDSVNISAVIEPSLKPVFKAFWNASVSVRESSSFFSAAIISSIDVPCSLATDLNVSL